MSEITQAQKTALLKLPGFKDIQKQYAVEAKQAGSGKRRMKKMRGGGFWDDVGNWFVQAGKDVNQFLKDTKIVSNVAAYALPILGAMGGALLTVNPLGATAGGIVGKSTADYIKSQGYGMHGKGPYDLLSFVAPLAGTTLNLLDATQKKIKGGELSNKLVINPIGQRLRGKGMSKTMNMAGQVQNHAHPMNSGIMRNIRGNGPAQDYRLKNGRNKMITGMGGIEYGSISSEFGNIKV